MLGILGGMGPAATADFLAKLAACTPAAIDQDHLPLVMWSVPQVPDRTRSIQGSGECPLPAMLRGMAALRGMGATAVAIPCNTAHHWYDQLVRESGLPILHIADAVAERLDATVPEVRRVGLIATEGTLRSGIYDRLGRELLLLPEGNARDAVARAIRLIKAGETAQARGLISSAIEALWQRGAEAVVLGCTEIPLAAPAGVRVVDSTEALARLCVRWFRGGSGQISRQRMTVIKALA